VAELHILELGYYVFLEGVEIIAQTFKKSAGSAKRP
jgi:hypothetical protein